MPGDPPNPCVPIPKVYPPDATQDQKDAIDAAYDVYLLGLTNCNGNQHCCAQVKIDYENAVAQIMGSN